MNKDNYNSNTPGGNNKPLPLISSAFLILTERCNLACKYCFVNQNPSDMTLEVAMDAVDFLIENAEKENAKPSINFFGGEPLLKWDEIIVPLTKYIREDYKKPFDIGMTSNCVLMTKDKLDFMKDNRIGLLFSIDGNKETQDINRPFHNGSGSFDVLEDKIPLILSYYPNGTFRSTIDHETVHHTFENMKFAIDSGYSNMFFVPNVFHDWCEADKDELQKQLRLFSDYFIEKMRAGYEVHLNPFDVMLRNIKQINRAVNRNEFRVSTCTSKCGLGAGKFASVGTDGVLFGCQEMTSNDKTDNVFKIGDIYNGVNDGVRMDLMDRFKAKEIKGSNCESCRLNIVCDGGCVANNYLINGDINSMPKMYCFWQQILLDEAIRVCNILGGERNNFFKSKYL